MILLLAHSVNFFFILSIDPSSRSNETFRLTSETGEETMVPLITDYEIRSTETTEKEIIATVLEFERQGNKLYYRQ